MNLETTLNIEGCCKMKTAFEDNSCFVFLKNSLLEQIRLLCDNMSAFIIKSLKTLTFSVKSCQYAKSVMKNMWKCIKY